MYEMGQKEVDAIARVIRSGKMFRYHKGGQCERFEKRYAERLAAKHVCMTSSGTTALTAAMIALEIGPGDEVIVPSHTYMATAVAVLAAGAIPVICDIDESITLDPTAFEALIGPRTRAVIPVHMWGVGCDMKAIRRIARKHKILIIEDACQSVGGADDATGKMHGTIGEAGGFSFNYFKNISCGEGGAVVTNKTSIMHKVRCVVDCCNAYWTGRKTDFKPFISNGSRASEFEGAMLNIQLDRLNSILRRLRKNKKRIVAETSQTNLTLNPVNNPEGQCATTMMYMLPSAEQADRFAAAVGGTVAGKTGRHTYTEWDPILAKRGAAHRAMDPFYLPTNKKCRMNYSKDVCATSLEILGRTVMIGVDPTATAAKLKTTINKIKRAAKAVGV